MVNEALLDAERGPREALGVKLRQLRKARGWTQEDLADRSAYSATHISAVETGRKPPTLRLSRDLDRIFELSEDTFERNFYSLRNGALLEGFAAYAKEEERAVEIRLFQIGLVPGLLQTPAYARALAEADVRRGLITEAQADHRLAYLAKRQASLERQRPPMLLVIMDESCLRHWVGGDDVMHEQFDALVAFAARRNAVLQVAPHTMGEARPFNLPVNLLTMADGSHVGYAESQAQGHVEREPSRLLSIRASYHHLMAEALSASATVALINQARKGKQ
ncbi:helix-turn-helix domain-containing protein [Streptomyces sp. NRRL F-5630]|uniref:helix-turn-helix domain-containing protein n=1 Tax=Streptomyces sp. NRRL F-5630 TaxID=1463864 RepID=UPI003D7323C0